MVKRHRNSDTKKVNVEKDFMVRNIVDLISFHQLLALHVKNIGVSKLYDTVENM